jgi:hypothetical protein
MVVAVVALGSAAARADVFSDIGGRVAADATPIVLGVAAIALALVAVYTVLEGAWLLLKIIAPGAFIGKQSRRGSNDWKSGERAGFDSWLKEQGYGQGSRSRRRR